MQWSCVIRKYIKLYKNTSCLNDNLIYLNVWATLAWYVVHVGHMPGIYQTREDCYAQVNRYPGNLHKKYNTEAEALRAYYTHLTYLAKPWAIGLLWSNECKPWPSASTGD